jgi:hypothetical protein
MADRCRSYGNLDGGALVGDTTGEFDMLKRCIREDGHAESHVWLESWDRVDGPPMVVRWDDPTKPDIRGAGPAELDWRSMFERYADHVGALEGTDFIDDYLDGPVPLSPRAMTGDGDLFTADELVAMRKLLRVKRRFIGAVAGFENLETVDGRIIRKLFTQAGDRRPVGQDGLILYYVDVTDGVLTIGGTIDNGLSGYPSIGLAETKLTNLAQLEDDVKHEAASPLVWEMSGFLSYVTLTDKPCWPGLTYLEGFPDDR